MADPFIGEIRAFSFDFAPRSWAFCDGGMLPINQNQALYSLLQTTFGGNGVNLFQLPDLRATVPMHNHDSIGQKAGESAHLLSFNEVPPHFHNVQGSLANANTLLAAGNMMASSPNLYSTGKNNPGLTTLHPKTVTNVGGTAHENRQPFLAVNFCIALNGTYPSKS